MNPLNSLIKEFAAPVLRDAGFKGRNREFVRLEDSGDCVIFTFEQPRVDPTAVVFEVHAHVSPGAYWDWVTLGEPEPLPKRGRSSALLTWAVDPPDICAHAPGRGSHFGSRWTFKEDESRQRCGNALGRTLQSDAIPLLLSFLEPELLRREIRTPSFVAMPSMSYEMRNAIVAVDRLPLREVNDLISAAEESGTPARFVSWIRERLLQRSLAP